jgi:hypothetical protein
MTEIAIRPVGEREFRVHVTERERQTTHRVTAPERLGGGLDLRRHDLSEVVRSPSSSCWSGSRRHRSCRSSRSMTSRATSPSTSGSSSGGLVETALGAVAIGTERQRRINATSSRRAASGSSGSRSKAATA